MAQLPLGSASLAIVLAGGKGTRMESDLPKVLVPVCGRPMIRYVIEALEEAGIQRIIVVVGYRAELVKAELSDLPEIEFALQAEQLGTGHAVMMCREALAKHRGPVLIVAGDSPLLQSSSVRKLVENFIEEQCSCILGTVEKADPTGYGRIIRDEQGQFLRVVEEKDASADERAIREINVSTYVFDSQDLLEALDQLTNANAQNEYYVTDCPALLLASGKRVSASKVLEPCESLSINSRAELAIVDAELKRQKSLNT